MLICACFEGWLELKLKRMLNLPIWKQDSNVYMWKSYLINGSNKSHMLNLKLYIAWTFNCSNQTCFSFTMCSMYVLAFLKYGAIKWKCLNFIKHQYSKILSCCYFQIKTAKIFSDHKYMGEAISFPLYAVCCMVKLENCPLLSIISFETVVRIHLCQFLLRSWQVVLGK